MCVGTAISSGCWIACKSDSPSDSCPFSRRSGFQVRLTLVKAPSNCLLTCLQVNGTHLSADSNSFLEKRRRGLIRFTNSLVRHPILGQEQLVVMFLTVPTVRVSACDSSNLPSDNKPSDSSSRNFRYGVNRRQSRSKTNSRDAPSHLTSRIPCPLISPIPSRPSAAV